MVINTYNINVQFYATISPLSFNGYYLHTMMYVVLQVLDLSVRYYKI